MRKISFEEYDKKRKLAQISLLKIRDDLDKKVSSGLRKRDSEKRFILYQIAKEKKESMLKKVGERKYEYL